MEKTDKARIYVVEVEDETNRMLSRLSTCIFSAKTGIFRKILLLLIVFILVFSGFFAFQYLSTPANSGARNTLLEQVPTTQSLILRGGFFDYFEADSFSNNTILAYNVSSNAPISTAIMSALQLDEFANNTNDPISNSITYQNGTSVQGNLSISPGQYFLVFYNYNSGRADIQFGYILTPNTPMSHGPAQGPFASGIATFGITNNSGSVTPYEIRTNEIVGDANISSMEVDTPNAGQYGVSVTGATLQLNTLLVVNDSSSSIPKVYWLQNVPDFKTGPSQVSFGDEIWNWTNLVGYLSNQSVVSTNLQNGGAVYPVGTGPCSEACYVYNYNGNNETYSVPFDFELLVKATVIPETGVLVQMGELLQNNGSTVPWGINWFDNITIVDPNVQSAYFDVTGNSVPPIGLYYDTELVFGGEGNAEVAHFTELNASLGLFYQSSTNASSPLPSFPTFYSFSGDTGESADDLVVTYSNGIATLGTGLNPNYVYLGNASQSLILQAPSSTSTTTTSSLSSSSTESSATQTSSTSTIPTSSTTTIVITTSSTSSESTSTTSSSILSTTQFTNSSIIPTTSSSISSTSNSISSTSSSSLIVGSSSTSSTNSTTPTSSTLEASHTSTKTTSTGISEWEWTSVAVIGIVIVVFLALMVLRRKPVTS